MSNKQPPDIADVSAVVEGTEAGVAVVNGTPMVVFSGNKTLGGVAVVSPVRIAVTLDYVQLTAAHALVGLSKMANAGAKPRKVD